MVTAAFDKLGFCYRWPGLDGLPVPDTRRAVFRAKKVLEGLVYDTVYLEDNPYTFPEVKTLLEGITVGGHRLEHQQQVLNQAESWRKLLALVEKGEFKLDKETYTLLHSMVAREEALTWGVFRDGDVSIAGTKHRPPPATELNERWEGGLDAIRRVADPHERGMAFFLFGALHQFFYDGNKRTARLMMNGTILSAGYDAIDIPAKKKQEFNEKMIRFYDNREGTEMMAFLAGCSLDPNPRLRAVSNPRLTPDASPSNATDAAGPRP